MGSKGGKVHSCCENCPLAFARDAKKHATAANRQLVQTGQAKQTAWPLSGGKLNPATKAKIGGVDVCFCCKKCQSKAKKGGVEVVFNDTSFDQGFKVSKQFARGAPHGLATTPRRATFPVRRPAAAPLRPRGERRRTSSPAGGPAAADRP